MLDSPIEGAINLSFCPEADGGRGGGGGAPCFSLHGADKRLHSSCYSIASLKSWADHPDSELTSLGSQDDDVCDVSDAAGNAAGLYSRDAHARIQPNQSCALTGRFQQTKPTFAGGARCYNAAKLTSRVLRAKALGRQYSSTPVLSPPRSLHLANRRVSLEASETDTGVHGALGSSKCVYSPTPGHSDVINSRRVSSALQLGQSSAAHNHPKANLKPEASRAESTSCCNSNHNVAQRKTGGEGLKFWRNNTNLGDSLYLSEEDIAPVPQSKSVASQVRQASNAPASPDASTSGPVSRQLQFGPDSKVGSNTSLNSWTC